MEICLKRNPFHALTSHIMNLRETYLLENMNDNKLNIKGSKNSENNENEAYLNRSQRNSSIDYHHMVLLIPNNLRINEIMKKPITKQRSRSMCGVLQEEI